MNDVAPVFTSGVSASVAENQTAAYIATATDAEGDTVSYSITGGADAALFAIDSTTGEVSFLAAPDFEAPGDADSDNTYEIEVTASDGTNTTAQTISISVTDITDSADPVLPSIALVNDTGRRADDGFTTDPALRISVDAPAALTALSLSITRGASVETIDIAGLMDASGVLSLSRGYLDGLLATPLSDGEFEAAVSARGTDGNTNTASLDIVLDTIVPDVPSIDLSRTSDSGEVGDGVTGWASVKLIGSAAPGDLLQLEGGSQVIADKDGNFSFDGVALEAGLNTFTVTVFDRAGNTSQTLIEIERTAETLTDPIVFWTETLLSAIGTEVMDATEASRALAIQSIALHDVVAALDGDAAFLVAFNAAADAASEVAIAYAAYEALSYLFPNQIADFDAALATALSGVALGDAFDAGRALGEAVAESVIALRDSDGWDAFVTHAPGTDPGDWQLTGPFYHIAINPQWASLDTFTLNSGDQFRPGGPLDISSEAYATALAEVALLGAADSSVRTEDQSEIARFWKNGAGTSTGPGQWNEIALAALAEIGAGTSNSVDLLLSLNLALADAGIAAWDAKYTYSFWRPETAIANAGDDGNPLTTPESGWTPFIIAPAHPEYVSGHSTFSGAAGAILTDYFGENFAFDATSEGLPGVTRSYTSFAEAAEEAGRSRIYGGIHYEFSNQAGLQLGDDVANFVLDFFDGSTDTLAPNILFSANLLAAAAALSDDDPGLFFGADFIIDGRVVDNLSGVTELFVRIDDGEFESVSFDSLGAFSLSYEIGGDGLADGVYGIEFFAIDAEGNTSDLFGINAVIDTAAPDLEITSLSEGGALVSGARLSGTYDATGSKLVALTYAINGGDEIPLAFNKADGTFDAALNIADLVAGDHVITLTATDAAGNETVETLNVTLAAPIVFEVVGFAPADASDEVGLTQRPQVDFSRAVDPASLTADSFFATNAAGEKLAANIVMGDGNKTAWLFFEDPMDGASLHTVTLKGDLVTAASDGATLDGDGDGNAGGDYTTTYTTVSSTGVSGTTLSGFVVGPGPDSEPMTTDDFSNGPDGIAHTDDDVFFFPLAGVEVYILGFEGQKVYTDENGYFELTDVPAGNVKVAVDGRTATNAPDGIFYPEMVMDVTLRAGQDNTLMGTMGDANQQLDNLDRGEVYLPRLSTEILVDISDTDPTEIRLTDQGADGLTAEERDTMALTIQPGSLLDENGNPVENPQVGLSTVPPELVADMLPEGLLQHTFDITIQSPDTAVFTEPATIVFPNVFNAEPGTKLNFLSFDHTTGRLVIEGTATVSADGKSVVTDPDTGVTKPGWHGLTPPGSESGGPNPPEDPDECPPTDFTKDGAQSVGDILNGVSNCLAKLSGVSKWVKTLNEVKNGIRELDSLVDELKEGLENGGSAEALLATVRVINSTKNILVPIAGALIDQSPAKKVEIALNCAKNLLSTAQSICDRIAETDDPNCEKPSFDLACFGLGFAKDLIEGGEIIAKTINEGLKSVALDATCFVVDKLIQLVEDKIRDEDVDLTLDEVFALIDAGGQLPFELSADDIDEILAAIEDVKVETALYSESIEGFEDLEQAEADALEGGATAAESFAPFFMTVLGLPQNAYYAIQLDDQIVRGRVGEDGQINAFLPANQDYTLSIYSPQGNVYGEATGRTSASGQPTELSPIFLGATEPSAVVGSDENAQFIDLDDDGLVDLVEFVIGTSATNADTDGDGLSDKFEIENDLDPLGGFPTTTGVLDSIDLGGAIREIAVTADIEGQPVLAFVATVSGLSVLDLSAITQPQLLITQTIADGARDVSLDGAVGHAAVIAGNGDLLLFDVSTPAQPEQIARVEGSMRAVEVYQGVAYTADEGEIVSYDLLTGDEIQRFDLTGPADSVFAMTQEGGVLYVVDDTRQLHAIEIDNDFMAEAGRLNLANTSGLGSRNTDKLFASDGVLYVPADSGFNAGYGTVDITDLANMSVLSGPDDRTLAGTDFADTGVGLGIVVGPVGGAFGTDTIMVVDTSDPTATDGFITRFDLDAAPTSVVIASGIAYVGDNSGLFHVVNATGFDTGGIAPEANIATGDIDIDPGTDGIQVEEGKTISLDATITDDAQIQRVEVLLNGTVISTDVTFPWSINFALPSIADNGGNAVTVQLRATDMGGNVGLSNLVELELSPDIVAPELVGQSLRDDAQIGQFSRTFRFTFSEPLAETAETENAFYILDPDGERIDPAAVQFKSDGRSVQVTFDPFEIGSHQFIIDGAAVTDRAGNPLSDGNLITDFEVGEYSVEWFNIDGGDWTDAASWSNGQVPGPNDSVLVSLVDGVQVDLVGQSFAPLNVRVASLDLDGLLVMTGNNNFTSLEAGELEILAGARLFLQRGTLRDTRVSGEGELDVTNGGELSNVTLALDVELTVGDSSLNIRNGLTIEESFSILAGNQTTILQFSGPQIVDGSGEIILSGENQRADIRFSGSDFSAPERLIFGEDLTLRGTGDVSANQTNDVIEIRGSVIAEGGRLSLRDIDNNGADLNADEGVDGILDFAGNLTNTRLIVAENAYIDITASTVRNVEIAGDGTARIAGNFASDLTVSGTVEITGDSDIGGGYTLTVYDSLTVDGALRLVQDENRFQDPHVYFNGGQTVDGTGIIEMSRENLADGVLAQTGLELRSSTEAPETLVFGAGLTIRGDGDIRAQRTEDSVQILGSLEGVEGGRLRLFNIDNQGETLTVDSSVGSVGANGRVANAVIEGDGVFDLFSGGGLNTVTLGMDARMDASNSSVSSFIEDGLTLDDVTLTLAAGDSRQTYLNIVGEQSFSGRGEIYLSTENFTSSGRVNNQLYFSGIDDARLFIGENITIRGSGTISAGSNDVYDIAGMVKADDGALDFSGIGDVTGVLGVSDDGRLDINQSLTLSEQSELAIDISAAGHGEIRVFGLLERGGILRLNVADDFTANLGDEFVILDANRDLAGAFDGFEGFDLDGDLAFTLIEDDSNDTLTLRVVTDAEAQAFIDAAGYVPPPILAPVREEIEIDVLDQNLRFVDITGTLSGGGRIEMQGSSYTLDDIHLNADLALNGASASRTLNIIDGLELNSALILEDSFNYSASLNFVGSQTVSGTGEIFFSRANASRESGLTNQIRFEGEYSGYNERLTFGEDITIRGDGVISANNFEDTIQILGTVAGIGDYALRLGNIDNDGEAMHVDTSAGRVMLSASRFTQTVFESANGGADLIELSNSVRLDDVTFNLNAQLDAASSQNLPSADIENGLTVNGDLTIAGAGDRAVQIYARGEQTIDGTGTIILSDRNVRETETPDNHIYFQGRTFLEETLIFGEDLTVRGEGYIYAASSEDRIDLRGTVIAENGELRIDDLASFSGTLEIARDGQFYSSDALDLDTGATTRLAFGQGDDLPSNGYFYSDTFIDLAGTLDLNVAVGFSASLGEEFVIAYARNGFAGAFDNLTGFDIDGDLALALVVDEDRLSVRVVDQADAGAIFLRSELPAAAELPVLSGTLTDATIDEAFAGGPEARVWSAVLESSTLEIDLLVQRESGTSSSFLTVRDGLTLNGQIALAPVSGATSFLDIQGVEGIDGSGTIILDLTEDTPFRSTNAQIRYTGEFSAVAETLVFGSDIDIRGAGTISASSSFDRIQILGDVTADSGRLTLSNINNSGADLTVDETRGGDLVFQNVLEDTRLVIADQVQIDLLASTLTGVEIAGAGSARIAASSVTDLTITGMAEIARDESIGGGTSLTIEEGLTVNGMLRLSGDTLSSANVALYLRGEQTVDGTGIIDMSRELTAETRFASNDIYFSSQSDQAEILTFGSGLTIRGDGEISAQRTGDTIQILGTLEGIDGGRLRIEDIDNQGEALTIDASAGRVGAFGRVADAVIDGAGVFDLFGGARLNAVTLGMDARIDSAISSPYVEIENGVTLDNATINIDGASDRQAYLSFIGEQSVDGNGEIVLSDVYALGESRLNNQLYFSGIDDARLFIGENITIRGSGTISAGSNDVYDIAGMVKADDGALDFSGIGDVTGVLGVSDDGRLDINQSLTLSEQSELAIDISAAGHGEIRVFGLLERGGILRLNVADDFTANLGDEFVILDANRDLAGAFDGFEGFDLDGDLAFTLIEDDSNDTLTLRVVTDAEAQAFIDAAGYVPPPILAPVREEIEIDVLDQNLRFVDITGTLSGGGRVETDGVTRTLDDVHLNADLALDASSRSQNLNIVDGLVLNADLIVEDSFTYSATIDFLGAQTISGAGEIFLSRELATRDGLLDARLNFAGEYSGFAESLVFGEDITIRGDGFIQVRESEDSIQILGTVAGIDGGLLRLGAIDNQGEAFSVDTSAGRVILQTGRFADAVINGANGDSDLLELRSVYLDGVTLNLDTEFDSIISSTSSFLVEDGLTVNADLTIAGAQYRQASSYFMGSQTIDGDGRIILSSRYSLDGETANSSIYLRSTSFVEETLTFGEDLTVQGNGFIAAENGSDWIEVLGTVIAEGGQLRIDDMQSFGGTLEVARDGQFYSNDTLNFESGATIRMAMGQSGDEAENGFFYSNSAITLGGALVLNVAAGFTASLGEEFAIGFARDGISGAFDSLSGFDIDGDLALALVVDEDRLSVRVVEQADAGAVFLRSELPDEPALPELSGTITGETIDEAFAGGPVARTSGVILDDTILDIDLLVERTSGTGTSTVSVRDGLTLNGDLILSPLNAALSTLDIRDAAGIDGSGAIIMDLSDDTPFRSTNAQLRFFGESSDAETLTIGADIEIRGAGSVTTTSSADRIQILGDVTAEGGRLTLSYINNGGADLNLAEARGGDIVLDSTVEDTRLVIADGTRIDLLASSLSNVEIAGDGIARISASNVSGLTITGIAEITSSARIGNNNSLSVEDGLTVNGTLRLIDDASPSYTPSLRLRGEQSVDGTGVIELSRASKTDGSRAFNDIIFQSETGEAEVLTFGAELTLRGEGRIYANSTADQIQILGNVEGVEGGSLRMSRIDNQGETLNIDASAGRVGVDGLLANATVEGSGMFDLFNSAGLDAVTLGMDTRLDTDTSSVYVTVENGLALDDANVSLEGSQSRTAYLTFSGEQSLSGTGEIILSAINSVGNSSVNNQIYFSGADEARLTIGESILVRGTGSMSGGGSDFYDIAGEVRADDGILDIWQIGEVTGVLGVSDDARLDINQSLTLRAESTLAIEMSADGHGLIQVFGTLERAGTLRLNVADGFTANLGDEFLILDSNRDLAGAFDTFEGFDLAGDLAFTLIQDDTNDTLTLRVVTDAEASAFINPSKSWLQVFDPEPAAPGGHIMSVMPIDSLLSFGPAAMDLAATPSQTVSGLQYQDADQDASPPLPPAPVPVPAETVPLPNVGLDGATPKGLVQVSDTDLGGLPSNIISQMPADSLMQYGPGSIGFAQEAGPAFSADETQDASEKSLIQVSDGDLASLPANSVSQMPADALMRYGPADVRDTLQSVADDSTTPPVQNSDQPVAETLADTLSQTPVNVLTDLSHDDLLRSDPLFVDMHALAASSADAVLPGQSLLSEPAASTPRLLGDEELADLLFADAGPSDLPLADAGSNIFAVQTIGDGQADSMATASIASQDAPIWLHHNDPFEITPDNAGIVLKELTADEIWL